MDALDVVYVVRSPWELGWDAIVGVGTLALAAVTVATLRASSRAEKRQQAEALENVERANIAATNNVIFEMARMFNKFLAIQKQFIAPHADKPDKHLWIQPAIGITWVSMHIDYRSLDFLFELGDPNILGVLSLLEQETSSTIDVIKQRSVFMLTEVQPVIEQLAASNPEGRLSPDDIERRLGMRKAILLHNLTDEMISGTENVLEGTRKEIVELRTAVKAIYPNGKIAYMKLAGAKEEKAEPA